MKMTAILIDGGFYKKRARYLFGEKDPKSRAEELYQYCLRHIKKQKSELYRIFYYDCPPSTKTILNPITQKSVNLGKSDLYAWTMSFFEELKHQRKMALRMGEILESTLGYVLKKETVKKLFRREITVDDLTEADLELDIQQKGVDMRIGLDISSLAYKRQVNQIILIAGDSDFVPAAKHARREGIDFILDPMWHTIKPSLYEHIDGLTSCVSKPSNNLNDPLCLLSKKQTNQLANDADVQEISQNLIDQNRQAYEELAK